MGLSAIQNRVRLLIPGIDQTISGIESACGRFPESTAPNLTSTELMRQTPWPAWDLRPDQPRNRGEDLRCAGRDGGAVGSIDGATHEQRRMPNPFQRIARPSRRHRIDSADALGGVALAT
jgi:hypothetical protein